MFSEGVCGDLLIQQTEVVLYHPPVGHEEPWLFYSKASLRDNGSSCQRKLFILSGIWKRGRSRHWHQQWKTLEPDPYYPLFGLVAWNFSASGGNYLRFLLIHTERFSSHILIPQRWIESWIESGPHPGCVEAWNSRRSRTKPLYESDAEPKLLLEFRTDAINAFAANRISPSALT